MSSKCTEPYFHSSGALELVIMVWLCILSPIPITTFNFFKKHQVLPIFPQQTGIHAGSDAGAACVSADAAASWSPWPAQRSVVLPALMEPQTPILCWILSQLVVLCSCYRLLSDTFETLTFTFFCSYFCLILLDLVLSFFSFLLQAANSSRGKFPFGIFLKAIQKYLKCSMKEF